MLISSKETSEVFKSALLKQNPAHYRHTVIIGPTSEFQNRAITDHGTRTRSLLLYRWIGGRRSTIDLSQQQKAVDITKTQRHFSIGHDISNETGIVLYKIIRTSI
ncbi:hypothetical protein O181_072886 [Austropuccinia psidii MF-1]|uniref:Uncharacterized protein n=1 Tax=Austropuccinia psidii MF-1 TaxID=1389203 RepID=A0A9Q3I7S9_9BASI|nr:hypothetical protein [Austropuccinia psidii MF-1]